MKKILFMVVLSVSLTVCLTSPTWAGGLDDYNAGVNAYIVHYLDEAIRLFTKAIASGELSRENLNRTYYARGRAWHDKKDYDKAIADYTKAIELDPKLADAYYSRGRAWHGKGAYDKAIADYTTAIKLDPKNAYTYYNRGNAWRDKGDIDKAIADYTKAIELYPSDALFYRNRGAAWEKKGNHAKAKADYDKAKEIEVDSYLRNMGVK